MYPANGNIRLDGDNATAYREAEAYLRAALGDAEYERIMAEPDDEEE